MALFTIGDLHLSEYNDKPMDIFGGVWEGYRDKLVTRWQEIVAPCDTVVICGDISWGISLTEALLDFKLIDSLNGKKIILKGNHDLWWDTITKMKRFFCENDVNSIDFLHNNCYFYNGTAICGTRGWDYEETSGEDDKVWRRELARLETSLKQAVSAKDTKEIYAFLHYPPIKDRETLSEFEGVMLKYNVSRCFYGHIHGFGLKTAFYGNKEGIDYRIVSADYLDFRPVKVL